MQRRERLFVPGLITGVVVGSVTAWLYAPQSGPELRARLHEHWLRARTTVHVVLGRTPTD